LRGVPGALLAIAVFLAGSTGLRAYISFVLGRTHAYGTIAAPIAALLFFFVLALGVLLGAEFNAAIEQEFPARVKPPRVLRPRAWQRIEPDDAAPNVATHSTGRIPRLVARARRGEGQAAPGTQRERLS
jgi:membrane protein